MLRFSFKRSNPDLPSRARAARPAKPVPAAERGEEAPSRPALGTGRLAALLLGGAALLAAACGGGPDPATVAEGKALFGKTCSSCHGADAMGMPKLGKSLHANAFVKQRSVPELVDFIKIGRPAYDPLNTTKVDMPPRGGNPALTDEDLALIATFVRTLSP